jgi:CubicO group peptidase (beta-lactamase class C family)
MVIAGSLLAAMAAIQVPAASQPVATPLVRADLEAWLDGFMPVALQQGDIAGAVVAVVRDGAVLLQKGYGLADVAKRTPMDPERTVLGVGSVSKLFTWTAVMQQVEQGKLDLDRDVNEYLDFELPARFGQPITLRHLMTHTAGFAARGFRQYADPRALGPHLRGTRAPPRIFPPGQVTAYSNYGSMLGGYLVERVSGEPFVDYVDRHVLGPLGMARSSFRRPVPEALRPDLATSYGLGSGPPNGVDRVTSHGSRPQPPRRVIGDRDRAVVDRHMSCIRTPDNHGE